MTPNEIASQAVTHSHGKWLCYTCQSPNHFQANCPIAAKVSETAQELINMMHRDLPDMDEVAY
jgi:Zinc knuckle